MTVYARRINAAQRQWLARYEDLTGFEPMHQEDLDAGTMTFGEVMWRNVHWYEDHTSDMHLRIQSAIPGTGEMTPGSLGVTSAPGAAAPRKDQGGGDGR